MIAPCNIKIVCPCDDDPIRNLSAEDPDRDRCIGIFNRILSDIPSGWHFCQPASKTLCYSEVSCGEAHDCARREAQEDIYSSICNPNSGPGDGVPDPGGPQDGGPGSLRPDGNGQTEALSLFSNVAVSRTSTCPDGSTFNWIIPAGTILALSQIEANTLAASLAQLRATLNRICITSSALTGGCRDEAYTVTIQAVGGTALFFPYILGPQTPFGFAGCGENFQPVRYIWQLIGGSLPPGLTLDDCTGRIEGTPTATGKYTFTVRATDAIGSFQQKTLTLCVIRITTASPLPDATEDVSYLQNLAETGGVQESETWQLVSGSLPAGLTLTSAGVLSGTPKETGDFSFKIRVTIGTCA